MNKWLYRLAAAIFCGLMSLSVAAQAWPNKPVKIIVPFPPGSTPDAVARLVGQKLSEMWNQPVVVDNKSGAAGNIGTDAGAKSPPDGYTLTVGINGPIAVNKALYDNLPYDPQKDLLPVVLLTATPQILAVHPSVPVANFKEFIDYAKANPGKLSYGSVGSGSASHLTMELLENEADISLVHIPYRGFPQATTDLLGSQIQAMFAVAPALLPHIKAEKVRALAITSAKRSSSTPDLPTIAELGFQGFEATAWNGFFVPAGTPRYVITKINADVQKVLAMPDVKEALAKQGFDIVGGSPQQFAAFIKTETERWTRIVKLTGAKPD